MGMFHTNMTEINGVSPDSYYHRRNAAGAVTVAASV